MLAEADAEIVRLNRTISGLAHLLDTELMQSILIDHGLLNIFQWLPQIAQATAGTDSSLLSLRVM